MEKLLYSYDPSNGEVVGSVPITPVEEINVIVDRAKEASQKWRRLSIDKRIELIAQGLDALTKNQQELGVLLSRENGKDLLSGSSEVGGCASDVTYRGNAVKEALQTQVTKAYGMQTELRYEPLGVCAVITPWNYPLSMAHWLMMPALMAGNTVVFKPSEETPLIAQKYVEALTTYLPDNVVQIVHGDELQGKALVESDVQMIAFTGSQAVGKDIMKNSSATLKRLVMELGGKDPLIVLPDADVDKAARFAVGNSYANAGQMCVSTERVFVHDAVADEFEAAVLKYAKYYKVGPWNDRDANIGPIINAKQRDIIINHISDAIDSGARVLAGGKNHPERYILPTVLSGITDDMLIAKEETFGPVVCITRYTELDAAIKSANHPEFGLGAAVYGGQDAKMVADRLEAGMVGINQGVGGVGDVPWVGAKQSGYGYHGSPDGHRQFTQVKMVSVRARG